MGNSESISNDLENIGNEIVNGVVDTGYKIADGGTTAINETTEIITDNIIIPIVKELDPGQVETIKQQTRKPIKPPKQPKPPKVNLRKDIIKPTNDIIKIIDEGLKIEVIKPANNFLNNELNQGLNNFNNQLTQGFNNIGNQLTNNLNIGGSSSSNKNNTNFEARNYSVDSLDDTTTYIIIGGVVIVAFLLLNNKK